MMMLDVVMLLFLCVANRRLKIVVGRPGPITTSNGFTGSTVLIRAIIGRKKLLAIFLQETRSRNRIAI
jgi:hypothetical protein